MLSVIWNDELDVLKSNQLSGMTFWLNAGQPSSGFIYQIKASCKLKYKFAIRHSIYDHENAHNDDLCDHFVLRVFQNSGRAGLTNFIRLLPRTVIKDGN